MKLTALVISAVPYSIAEKGQTNEGLSLTYVEEGVPIVTPQKRGMDVIKESAPLECWQAIVQVPGFYELEMGRKSTTDARGKKHTTLYPIGVEYLGPVDLFEPVKAAGIK